MNWDLTAATGTIASLLARQRPKIFRSQCDNDTYS